MRALIVAALLLVSVRAEAHPHAWIDLSVRVIFGADGRVAALRQTWLFDDFYSLYVLDGAEEKGAMPSQEGLDALMVSNMKNLADYKYFTQLSSGETPLSFGDPTNMATRMNGKRLEMTFELPLTAPVHADDIAFTYAIFDPTYYIEMLHAKADDAVALIGAPDGCKATINEPNPDPDQIILAASLAQEDTSGGEIGRFFAQDVRVTCG